MIRYACTREQLESAINSVDGNWIRNANKRTTKLITQGRYQENSAIWSTVKPCFIFLQQNKCAFCERRFESAEYNKIEFDLEHFRPKGSVETWPNPSKPSSPSYVFSTGEPSETGYYWLAYDIENYAAACKVCNSICKSNYFPVSGPRAQTPSAAQDLIDEKAFLCNPVGCIDVDPEDLVTFVGTVAIPSSNDEWLKRRGQVIIDFFELNKRQMLHLERAEVIARFGLAMRAVDRGSADEIDAKLAAGIDSPALPHSNCLRSFRRLWDNDRNFAMQVLNRCREIVVSR